MIIMSDVNRSSNNASEQSGNERLQQLFQQARDNSATAKQDDLSDLWAEELRRMKETRENGEKPTVVENLVKLREIQYKTIEKLCAMLTAATGEDHSQALETFIAAELSALVTVTKIVSDQGAAIDSMVEECRKLIGI